MAILSSLFSLYIYIYILFKMENSEFEKAKAFAFNNIIEYAANSVVSKTIIKKPTGTVTLFSFDKGEALSEHTAPFDALVQIIDGSAEVIIDGKSHLVEIANSIILPANVPHALKAVSRFKMLLTMIRSN
jgi:quercetin dioxygenase-like cupin family protein